ncbi:hypothetical protein VTJ49DRAFT_1506 [Mycothermus thermophilus]|uniref:Uncharacterized protein n=1 Tax=Humicola insolens TaxID=85995 RepID=A0ABR3VCH0_HUMIN
MPQTGRGHPARLHLRATDFARAIRDFLYQSKTSQTLAHHQLRQTESSPSRSAKDRSRRRIVYGDSSRIHLELTPAFVSRESAPAVASPAPLPCITFLFVIDRAQTFHQSGRDVFISSAAAASGLGPSPSTADSSASGSAVVAPSSARDPSAASPGIPPSHRSLGRQV